MGTHISVHPSYPTQPRIKTMKKVFIIFLLLQVINVHLCEEDEEFDAELTAEEAEELDAALDRSDDIIRPDNWCSNKRFKMCRRKLWKLFRYARDECGDNVKCIYRKISMPLGKCKPCLCRALYVVGPRVFGNKMTLELMLMAGCYE